MIRKNIEKIREHFSFEKLNFYVLVGIIFLLPFFYIPSFGFHLTKIFIFFVGVSALILLYILYLLKNRSIKYPSSRYFLIFSVVPFLYLLSGLLSSNIYKSLIGFNFENNTFIFILVLFVLMYMVFQTVSSVGRIVYVLFAIFLSILILLLINIIRIVFVFLPIDLFQDVISSTVGGVTDLAILFSVGIVLILITLEEINLTKWVKRSLWGIYLVLILFLVLINIAEVWIVLGFFTLFYFVYISINAKLKNKKLYTNNFCISLGTLIISVVFILSGQSLVGNISDHLGLSAQQNRLSWNATYDLVESNFEENIQYLLVGSGPNSFSNQWFLNRPESVTKSIVWNQNFNSGSSWLVSSIVNVGMLGFLGWLSFIGFIIFIGIRSIFFIKKDRVSWCLGFYTFWTMLILWLFILILVPNLVILILAFIFTGVFLSSLIVNQEIILSESSFLKTINLKKKIILSLFLILFIVVSVNLFYIISQKIYASYIFNKAQSEIERGDIHRAGDLLLKANLFSQNDLYLRFITQIFLFKADQVTENLSLGRVGEEEANDFFNKYVDLAFNYAGQALEIDRFNYLNLTNIASVYRKPISVVEDQNFVSRVYQNAINSYDLALSLNPYGIDIYLEKARLNISMGLSEDARVNLLEALASRPNYLEALLMMSRLELSEDRAEESIRYLERAINVSQNDLGLILELGLIYYNLEDYSLAKRHFGSIVDTVPDFADARYYLGLSYAFEGDYNKALIEFQVLDNLNPDNSTIERIIENLKEENNPFSGLYESEVYF